MRQLHQSLRENHHLRHGGRMQYGLFLKGIGLSLEQALQFWRSEFIRGKVDADKVMLTVLVLKCYDAGKWQTSHVNLDSMIIMLKQHMTAMQC